ncbi:retrovirus-related pol polyprotein from transposon 17.6 [Tanacetum coccineum]
MHFSPSRERHGLIGDSCGIHLLLMDTGIAIHMLIEKKYPLTQEMLSRMLSRRLEVDHEISTAGEDCRKYSKSLLLLVVKLLLLVLVTTAKRVFAVSYKKWTFTCPYGTFAYKQMPFGLCNAPATFQRCMTAIFYELIEDSMEVFIDDFSVFGSSFDHCLKNLEKMLKRCKETNLVLNWEKCHFMVKEGIILGHKVSGSGIEVDKAKIKAISKLPYPTNVKAIRSFLGHAGFYRRFIKDFSQIARPMTQLLVKDAPFNFSEECI